MFTLRGAGLADKLSSNVTHGYTGGGSEVFNWLKLSVFCTAVSATT